MNTEKLKIGFELLLLVSALLMLGAGTYIGYHEITEDDYKEFPIEIGSTEKFDVSATSCDQSTCELKITSKTDETLLFEGTEIEPHTTETMTVDQDTMISYQPSETELVGIEVGYAVEEDSRSGLSETIASIGFIGLLISGAGILFLEDEREGQTELTDFSGDQE